MECNKFKSCLCAIKSIMHIVVFFALALVLFDIHSLLKPQKEYAQAIAAQSSMQLNSVNNHN